MSVKMRQEVERKIATAFIQSALKAGFLISVDNGEDETRPMSNEKSILSAMFQTDEDRLYTFVPKSDGSKRSRHGWVYFIYGNDGWDVISDYTVNLQPLMAAADKISDYYEG